MSASPALESTLRELESLLNQLERGDLPLDEALQTFEKGVQLTRQCQQALAAAQQRVQILTQRNGESVLEPFVPNEGGTGSDAEQDAAR